MTLKWFYGGILGLGMFLTVACSSTFREPVERDSFPGTLDLRTWNFQTDGSVIPQGWAWDPDVLWSPVQGRPNELPLSQAMGPPDRGGAFVHSLMRSFPSFKPSPLAAATARLTIFVRDDRNLGLQIGAVPGAFRVWVNGVVVWDRGVLSTNPLLYRADGAGTLLTVQPKAGVVDLVLEIVTSDPMIRHSELNRYWVIGPAETMMAAYETENGWRSFQAAVLVMGIFVFFWIAILQRERRVLLLFAGFLAVCLVKLYANVEQLDPLPNQAFPGGSLCLFLNHGLNLLPFPLLVLYLARQFPEEVSIRASAVFLLLAVLVSLWELLPFVVLAFGWESLYSEILGAPWRFILNFCVVLATLYIFERLYQAFIRKRPLSGALFLGGIVLGLIVLLPIPLSYFAAVKHVYFLGWGLFFFQGLMVFEVVRLQVRTNEAEVKGLKDALERRETLGKFIAPDWARRLSRDSVETLRPGDNRSAEAVLVQFRSPDSPELWLPLLGAAVSTRKAVLVDRSAGTFSWALESWSETALAFALEAQQKLLTAASLRFKILLTKATVKYHILNLDSLWFPMVSDFPFDRLEELYDKAERYGATLVLDGALRDGLAIGGWRRHRSISVAGTEIELYEGETEPLAQLKDKTLDSFESALGSAREENWPEAIRGLFAVVRENPFDQAARTLLSEWGQSRRL